MHYQWHLPYVLGAGLTAGVLFNLPSARGDAPETAPAPSERIAANNPPVSDSVINNARVSLSLREAPITHMLSLLTLMTKVHFRYATPPDARITATFNDAPLVPRVTAWLGATGFDLRRAGPDFFVFREAGRPPFLAGATLRPGTVKNSIANGNVRSIPSSWQYWNWSGAPPANWTKPGAVDDLAAVAADSVSQAAWRPAVHGVRPEIQPGVSVALPGSGGPTKPVYLRCVLPLKFVPRGAQLVLETPTEATLYVNGAVMLRRWKGRRVVDMSRVLAPGHNCICIQWSAAPPDKSTFAADSLLRYEWFFAGSAN